MPAQQIVQLRELSRVRLAAGNKEQKNRFLKFVYVEDTAPRIVLWESHVNDIRLDVSSSAEDSQTVFDIHRDLAQLLPTSLRAANTELRFASADLEAAGGQEHLRNFLAIYCDKIYVVLKQNQADIPNQWQVFHDYFTEAGQRVRSDPAFYTGLCRSLQALHAANPGPGDSGRLYQHLVLLRSLPDSLASRCAEQAKGLDGTSVPGSTAYIEAAASVRALLELLERFHNQRSEKENAVTIYSVINTLEWLAYLAPRMYSAETTAPIPNLHEALANRLLYYVLSNDFPLAIRLEAAWALGWAAVSSIPLAAYVQERLKAKDIRTLHSEVLRHVAGGAYLRASFTLASFGPARVTAGATQQIPPGGFYGDVSDVNQRTYKDALKAASEVVYSQLKPVVGDTLRTILFTTVRSWIVRIVGFLLSLYGLIQLILTIVQWAESQHH